MGGGKGRVQGGRGKSLVVVGVISKGREHPRLLGLLVTLFLTLTFLLSLVKMGLTWYHLMLQHRLQPRAESHTGTIGRRAHCTKSTENFSGFNQLPHSVPSAKDSRTLEAPTPYGCRGAILPYNSLWVTGTRTLSRGNCRVRFPSSPEKNQGNGGKRTPPNPRLSPGPMVK